MNTNKPDLLTHEDITLVEYRDLGACSTFASRYLEVVVLSKNLGEVPRYRPVLTIQSEGCLRHRVDEKGRGPSLLQTCMKGAPKVQNLSAPFNPWLLRERSPFGDRTWYQQYERNHQEYEYFTYYQVDRLYHDYEGKCSNTCKKVFLPS